jgi:hypothetical protein
VDVTVGIDLTGREQQGEGLFVFVGHSQGHVAEWGRGAFSDLNVVASKPAGIRLASLIFAKQDQGGAGLDEVMGERVHERSS